MTHPSFEDPYIIERTYAKNIESLYDNVMEEINAEKNLSQDVRLDLLTWLIYVKHRSPIYRDFSRETIKFILEMQLKYNKKEIPENERKIIQDYANWAAKETHLSPFLDKEANASLVNLHIDTLSVKSWKILKSSVDQPFLTNDNPGYSPNQHLSFAKDRPFHHVMELNSQSIIYYVLSPKYCLLMTPFLAGTPIELNCMNMEIIYEQITPEHIDMINWGAIKTSYKLVIANDKKIITSFMKNKSNLE